MIKIVLTTLPDHTQARQFGQALVQDALAACVNIIPGITSIYSWEGAIEQASECLLVIKTSAERLPELRGRMKELHPYKVPEIVTLDPSDVHESYARWVTEWVNRP